MWIIDDKLYVIFEYLGVNNEEKELVEYGMMFWGNLNYDYNEVSMGYISNFLWVDYGNCGWFVLYVIVYMESYDEECLMYKNLEFGNFFGSYSVKDFNIVLC